MSELKRIVEQIDLLESKQNLLTNKAKEWSIEIDRIMNIRSEIYREIEENEHRLKILNKKLKDEIKSNG